MRRNSEKHKRMTHSYVIRWEGRDIPVQRILESRRTARVAIGSRGFLIRLPRGLSPAQVMEAQKWAEEWMQKRLREDAGLAQKLSRRTYRHGDWLELSTARYQLHIRREDRRTATGRLKGNRLELVLPVEAGPEATARLLSRILGRAHLPEVRERVHNWNDRHFRQPIGEVRLKYTRSRWGSCSSQGNINLSTRLLFAPQSVLDYVIVHELAHRLEMNHSDRFWAVVEGVMPDYRAQEEKLKVHRHEWDF